MANSTARITMKTATSHEHYDMRIFTIVHNDVQPTFDMNAKGIIQMLVAIISTEASCNRSTSYNAHDTQRQPIL